MGEGLVFSCLLSRFIFIFAFLRYDGMSGLDYVNTSLLILIKHISLHELESFL